MRFLLGFVTFFALVLMVGAILVWAGAYNFAASHPHLPLTRQVIDYALKRSVAVRAGDILVPSLAEAGMVRDGARHYREMCEPCHGAPGAQPAEFARGLMPPPPDLGKAVPRWRPAELFWIVKHGIKPTGMPAWGGTHADKALWDIVAFLMRLPDMPIEQYQQLSAGDGHPAGPAPAAPTP